MVESANVKGSLVLLLQDITGLIFGAVNQVNADLQQPESEVAEANNVWQYYTATN